MLLITTGNTITSESNPIYIVGGKHDYTLVEYINVRKKTELQINGNY